MPGVVVVFIAGNLLFAGILRYLYFDLALRAMDLRDRASGVNEGAGSVRPIEVSHIRAYVGGEFRVFVLRFDVERVLGGKSGALV